MEYRIKDNSGKWIYKTTDNIEQNNINLNTIGQYVGKRDRHGIKIYNGDIVTIGGRLKEVYWNEKELQWYVQNKFGKTEPLCINIRKYKVVGNIYDNPELSIKQ